jgi:hypothetical protein
MKLMGIIQNIPPLSSVFLFCFILCIDVQYGLKVHKRACSRVKSALSSVMIIFYNLPFFKRINSDNNWFSYDLSAQIFKKYISEEKMYYCILPYS